MSQLLLCSVVIQTFRYFIGVQPCLLLVSLHARLDIFCLYTAIQQLNSNYVGRSGHFCCLCSKLMVCKRSRVYCSKSNYTHQSSRKKACIRSFETNNSSQSLTRMYHDTATESLYRLCGGKINWTLTLTGLSC